MWRLWQDIETVFALHDKSSENAALAEISGVSGDAARNARRMSQAVLRGVSSGVGRVAESGSHAELIAKGGAYAQLVKDAALGSEHSEVRLIAR